MVWSFHLSPEAGPSDVLAVRTQEASFAGGLWSLEAFSLRDGCSMHAQSSLYESHDSLCSDTVSFLASGIRRVAAVCSDSQAIGCSFLWARSAITLPSRCNESEQQFIITIDIARVHVEDVRCS
jgi:hypothetical protein